MAKPTSQGAIIYTRVSSKDQVDSYSLDNQERACRNFATRGGYDVVKVFTERGESAKTADRTELQAMLKYVNDNSRELGVVIVYKVDRLARNSTDHGNLRLQLAAHGVRLQSATENLDNTPAGRFAETTLAAIAQLDNEVRAERAKDGMIAAVAAGRFVWPAPIGYINGAKIGPSLVPDSPSITGLVQKAWVLVESGMLPYEARRQLVQEGLLLRSGTAPSQNCFLAMLRSETYIGYIKAFGKRVRGDFEPLVDADLFSRVQALLTKSKGPVAGSYRKTNPDFPLRGTVLCPHCGKPLTAAWSRGHGGRYGYYRCDHCSRVAFRKEDVEPKFISHLDALSFGPNMTSVVSKAIITNLGENAKSSQQDVRKLETRLQEQHNRRSQIVEKSLKNVLPDNIARSLIEETDRAIRETEAEKRRCLQTQSIDLEVINAGLALLDKMGTVWAESDIATRKQLQRFVFPDGTSFDGSSFGTTPLPTCLQLKERDLCRNYSLVRPTGFEPVIYGSGGHRLIQLGHGRTRRQV